MCSKLLCRLLKKISEARRAKFGERRRTFLVRWSEPGKRNEAYEAFSAALPGCRCPFFDL